MPVVVAMSQTSPPTKWLTPTWGGGQFRGTE
jgi:hypothetical protein